jgi:hypothetical protein
VLCAATSAASAGVLKPSTAQVPTARREAARRGSGAVCRCCARRGGAEGQTGAQAACKGRDRRVRTATVDAGPPPCVTYPVGVDMFAGRSLLSV